MAKRKTTKVHARHTPSVRRKTTARRRKRTGLHDGKGLTGNPYMDAAAGVGLTLLARWAINKLPSNMTEKLAPEVKILLASGVGIGVGYMMKSKPMMMGAGAAGVAMVAAQKLEIITLNDDATGVTYVNPNLLNDFNDNSVMYLSDPMTGQTYGVNDNGQVMNLADSEAYGWTVQ